MLWVDADFVNAEALSRYEAEVHPAAFNIQTHEGITIAGSGGQARRVVSELRDRLLAAAASQAIGSVAGGADARLLAAMIGSGSYGPDLTIEQVVVSDPRSGYDNPVKAWACWSVLVDLYRQAINRAEADRYLARYEIAQQERDRAWRLVESRGIPYVYSPLFAPGASGVPDSGGFDLSDLSTVTQAGTTAGSLWAAVTWTDASYAGADDRGVHESAPSAIAGPIQVDAGKALKISRARLNPPTAAGPRVGAAEGVVPATAAAGWNAYVGRSPADLRLQNASAIALATTTYTLAADPSTTGVLAHHGQDPDAWLMLGARILRG